jgi:colanic acid/amylovoran/stewartan biosynthesis glycosyltransferase WcaL/AmsK/CpsK
MTTIKEFALFRNNFLPLSETFIHDQLRFHKKYKGVVFARKQMNQEVYKGHEVYSTDEGLLGANSPGSLFYGLTGIYKDFFKKFKEKNFTHAHAHFGHNGLSALPYTKKFNLPLVCSLHGRDVTILIGSDRYNPSWFYYTSRKKQLFDNTTLFLAASTELKELIIEAGCPEEKIVIHRLGIDLELFKKREKDPDGVPTVLMVGRFVRKKGFSFGIRAFAQVVKKGVDANLLIIGDGPLRENLENLIESLGIEDKVSMPGAKPHGDVVKAMALASVVITPSLVAPNMDRESGLIVAKEAQATGVPVLAHWHGGLPDIVDNGKTGFLFPERDVKGMGEKLELLLKNKRLRKKFGNDARIKMENEYNIINRNEVLENLYDEVVNGKKSWK